MKEYRVVVALGAKRLEEALNTEAAEGWQYCGTAKPDTKNPVVIMEREVPDIMTFCNLTIPVVSSDSSAALPPRRDNIVVTYCVPETCQAAKEIDRLAEFLGFEPDRGLLGVVDYAIAMIRGDADGG